MTFKKSLKVKKKKKIKFSVFGWNLVIWEIFINSKLMRKSQTNTDGGGNNDDSNNNAPSKNLIV